MAKKNKGLTAFLLIGVAFGSFLLIAGFSGMLGAEYQIGLTPTSFQPIQVDKVSYDVRDGNGNYKTTVDASSALMHYTDPLGILPDIDMIYSQPFSCDPEGNPIILTSNPVSGKLYVEDKLYFLNEYYFGVDVGVRTYAHMKNTMQPTKYLDPLRGFSTNFKPWWWAGGQTLGPYSTTDVPVGTLTMGINGGAGWTISSKGTNVADITNMLEPQDFQIATWNTPVRQGYAIQDAILKLQTQWGNSKAIVQPNITLKGMNEYVKYSYNRKITLPNGTQAIVRVDTSSAKVGFVDCYKTQYEIKGLVPNSILYEYNKRLSMTADNKEQELNQSPVTNAEVENRAQSFGGITLEGSVRYMGDAQAPAQTGGAAINYFNNKDSLKGSVISIDLNNLDRFSLPQKLWFQNEFQVQPLTTLKIADMRVRFGIVVWNGITSTNDLITGTAGQDGVHFQYPYNIHVDNVYVITRYVAKVAVISENNPQVIVNGRPIDPSLITDFEITDYGLDPTINDFKETMEFPPGFLNQIIGWIIAIVVIITVTYVIVQFMRARSGAAGGRGGTNFWDYLISRKK